MPKTTEVLTFLSPEGEEIRFPLATVTGEKPGPLFVITAGIHGCEYPGIAASIRLFKELDPAEVHGTVKIVPVTSVAAFEQRNPFVSPLDKKNPNRSFPGRLDGTYTDALSYHVLNDIIKGADFHLDLHCGDLVEALDPFSICHVGAGEKIDEMSYKLAYYYGLHNLIKTRWDGEWPDSGTTYANAAVNGTASAIVEAGGIGQLEPEMVEMHMKGLYNVLCLTGVLEGEVTEPRVEEYSIFEWVYSPWKGIFYKNVEVGQEVQKGCLLGVIEDWFGEVQGEVYSKVDGKVVFMTTSPSMAENGLLMGIACK